MHEAVRSYVKRFATDEPISVLDIGGRDLNGSVRDLFPAATYTVLDILPGPGVDIVADAATWREDGFQECWGLVVCCEVFEHTPRWPLIIETIWRSLYEGGRAIITCAGAGRAPHSGIHATGIQPGEYYANLDKDDLRQAIFNAGFVDVECAQVGLDLQATAIRPEVWRGD